ncbi:hypothetical protein PWY87_34090 [Kribbella solani]|uniref:phage holin n=1 Tax=Kribbella solani TaxID=236067 RepID=UPI0029BC0A2E|nr:hypothetical protein [Kribbella solani]MDX3006748.1 hypothetical protein [Kribbella solani]
MNRLLAAVRRRPVRVYLYGLIAPGFALAVAYGLTTADKAALWITLGGAALVVTGGELAQTKTTPTADPRTADGRPAELRPEPPKGDDQWTR